MFTLLTNLQKIEPLCKHVCNWRCHTVDICVVTMINLTLTMSSGITYSSYEHQVALVVGKEFRAALSASRALFTNTWGQIVQFLYSRKRYIYLSLIFSQTSVFDFQGDEVIGVLSSKYEGSNQWNLKFEVFKQRSKYTANHRPYSYRTM